MPQKANADIYGLVKNKGLFLWQVADELKMQDSNLSKLLRHELSLDKKTQVLKAIKNLTKAGG